MKFIKIVQISTMIYINYSCLLNAQEHIPAYVQKIIVANFIASTNNDKLCTVIIPAFSGEQLLQPFPHRIAAEKYLCLQLHQAIDSNQVLQYHEKLKAAELSKYSQPIILHNSIITKRQAAIQAQSDDDNPLKRHRH